MRTWLAAVCIVALTACSGGSGDKLSPDAGTIAHSIADTMGDQVTGVTVLTEDTDPNNLLGRQGGYTSAAVLSDVDLKQKGKAGVAWGGTVEVFPTAAEAKARVEHIKQVLSASPFMGTEYDYVEGGALLRLIDSIKPSVAAQYEAAFKSAVG